MPPGRLMTTDCSGRQFHDGRTMRALLACRFVQDADVSRRPSWFVSVESETTFNEVAICRRGLKAPPYDFGVGFVGGV